jgi:WhiB family redox-sensing transcriptional regulator
VNVWQQRALCAQVDPHLFHPDAGDSAIVGQAKRVCGRCPVRRQCLDHALTHGETRGVWGGHTAGERKALKQRRTMAGREAAA